MNLPNTITTIRILAIPALILLVGMGDARAAIGAFVAFLIVASTDWVDGYIARKTNAVTNLGKLLDPLADKLLVCGLLIAFIEWGQVPAYMVIVIVAREFIVTTLRIVAVDAGYVLPADMVGKIKTTLQLIAIGALLFDHITILTVAGYALSSIALMLAFLFTIYSGIHYLYKNRSLLQTTNK